MKLEKFCFYHLYNRTNNREIAFRNSENYIYFLQKYRKYCSGFLDTLAYCIMPTHFHMLVYIKENHSKLLNQNIGLWLSTYCKAFNSQYSRHGNLFQQHTKARYIDDKNYLLTVIAYIHQNPLRGKLVNTLDEWPYSSYLDLVGKRNGSLPVKHYILEYFSTLKEFEDFSQNMIKEIKSEYWF